MPKLQHTDQCQELLHCEGKQKLAVEQQPVRMLVHALCNYAAGAVRRQCQTCMCTARSEPRLSCSTLLIQLLQPQRCQLVSMRLRACMCCSEEFAGATTAGTAEEMCTALGMQGGHTVLFCKGYACVDDSALQAAAVNEVPLSVVDQQALHEDPWRGRSQPRQHALCPCTTGRLPCGYHQLHQALQSSASHVVWRRRSK